VNPADSPIMILALTSRTYTKAKLYDAASTIVQQKVSQVSGVGQIHVGGSAPPAVRVDVNPTLLHHFGLGLDDIRLALNSANANRPTGQLSDDRYTWSLRTTDQLMEAKEYEPLIVSYRNGAPVRLRDIARVTDSVEDIRASGLANGEPAVLLVIFRQPGANIIETVESIRTQLPQLQADIPADIRLTTVLDRTTSIRASVEEVQITLLLSIGLVVLVIFVFLRSVRATIIPAIVVPVSLVSTFGVMYLAGYSIDNLSLMALTIATGFVVDDAIVVIENITRYLERGMSPLQAALRGAREIGFTVLSITASLIAVFIPILLMSGIVGRLFREFAVTLSVAIGVSLIISLTTTPMMCAVLLKPHRLHSRGFLYRASEKVFDYIVGAYAFTLRIALWHRFATLAVTLTTIGVTIYLYIVIPKGLFPQQDTGRLTGSVLADQDTSFQAMDKLLNRFAQVVMEDPAVESLNAFTGGRAGSGNSARMFGALKPIEERELSADQVIARLRPKLAKIPGATLSFQPVQDIRVGGRPSSSQYQFTLRGDNIQELNEWGRKVLEKLRTLPRLVDVTTDQQDRGLRAQLTVDRDMAARLGVTQLAIDNALYDAFGQRQVSTIYTELNQYRVVMGVEPRFLEDPETLRYVYVPASNGRQVPLSAFARYTQTNAALSVNHSGQFPSITISFNLAIGTSLGEAIDDISAATAEMRMPATIHGTYSGTAQAFQESLRTQPLLILAALVTVYIVLGILYESYIHPITILSTLPSAGVGALVALMWNRMELNVMGIIGILLLIGIVKKNAIMMIDFALDAERKDGKTSEEAIYEACLLRFRPIVMTTMAALLGALPLALGTGMGAELRRPLGIAIVGGLIFSQLLTLYTTPVVYLFLDQLRLWWSRPWRASARMELEEVNYI
jgi:multidrug efflux pump